MESMFLPSYYIREKSGQRHYSAELSLERQQCRYVDIVFWIYHVIVKTAGKEDISHSDPDSLWTVFVSSCNFFWCIKKLGNRKCKCTSGLLQLGCLIPSLESSQILLVFFSSEPCIYSCTVVELQQNTWILLVLYYYVGEITVLI